MNIEMSPYVNEEQHKMIVDFGQKAYGSALKGYEVRPFDTPLSFIYITTNNRHLHYINHILEGWEKYSARNEQIKKDEQERLRQKVEKAFAPTYVADERHIFGNGMGTWLLLSIYTVLLAYLICAGV